MGSAKLIIAIASLFLGLQTAQAEEVTSCYIPGFLTFSLDATSLSVDQRAYGLQHGPATTLAQSLGILPAEKTYVESLVISSIARNGRAVAKFTFVDGSVREVDFNHVEFSLRDGTASEGGKEYAAKIVDVNSSRGPLLSMTAQANLCNVSSLYLNSMGIAKFFEGIPKPPGHPVNSCTQELDSCPANTHLGPGGCMVLPNGLRHLLCDCCAD